ncbi:T9SS type A sorting domain-containing protein [Muricauda oceani]|uniref:T9SS type A sorting domain-containing protein n=1 Tax=Flagellimonas oceani TaxID=2698672 RepID=A0A6G7J0H0_9FLAO|nr:T9SS type A sorting domain-containing protein [Allomuricauda oceani]MBW8244290.1 T9SS type A sorting domain-containing protein [Allomuricauda oceani]QII44064.1 T9SS type A sorting domain-containing protein [Allomuricauda oceani]
MRLFTLAFLFCYSTLSFGQDIFKPYSDIYKLDDDVEKHSKVVFFSKTISQTLSDDKLDSRLEYVDRYAVTQTLNYSPSNSGVWTTLKNGAKIWRIKLKSPGAKFLNIVFGKFHIPPGGLIHIYNNDRSEMLGGFTEANNQGDFDSPGSYASGIISDDEVILEYFQSKGVKGEIIIEISEINHGIKAVNIKKELELAKASATDVTNRDPNLNTSGPCQVNINCSEGNNWQNEKQGVAVFFNGITFCTGSLVNNTSQNGIPYFLTADHCLGNKDAVSNPNASGWIFYWNYEQPGCANSPIQPTLQSTFGATLVANDDNSDNLNTDFGLLRLSESPAQKGFNTYFNGWDRTQNPPAGGVVIHHPRVDVKKIATYTVTPIPSQIGYAPANWDVSWIGTTNGYSVVQPGSSGSPLISANKRILGVLSSSTTTNCTNPQSQIAKFGRFSSMWDNPYSIRRRVRDYLDPTGTNKSYMSGRRFYPEDVDLVINYLESDFEMYISASVIGGSSPYKWYVNSTLIATTTNPSFSYRYRCQGGNSIISVVSSGGGSDSKSYYEDCSGGGGHKSVVYPNPSTSEITINNSESGKDDLTFIPKKSKKYENSNFDNIQYNNANVKVFSQTGKLVIDEKIRGSTSEIKINVSNLRSGIYFLKITDDNGKDEQHQILVK